MTDYTDLLPNAEAKAVRHITGTPDYPENYWARPCVMGESRGILSWPAGGDSLFAVRPEATTTLDPDGWRWNGPAEQIIVLRVQQGTNNLSIGVRHNNAATPRPTLHVLPNAELGIPETIVEATDNVTDWQELAASFEAAEDGFTRIRLHWDLVATGQRCVWRNVSASFGEPIPAYLPPPTRITAATFTADQYEFPVGGSAVLSWSSAHALSLVLGPNNERLPPSGSLTVTPATSTTYTLTATGLGNTVEIARPITVYQIPQGSFNANPVGITQGAMSELSWTSQDGVSAAIDQGVGPVALSGTRNVSPNANTTYTLTITGLGGTITRTAAVAVYPLPAGTFSALPTTIDEGQSATLTWTSSNTTSASINQGVGAVALSGSTVVTPAATTTYTLTLTGPVASVDKTTTVTVNPRPGANTYTPPAPASVTFPGFVWTDDSGYTAPTSTTVTFPEI